jgi:hypothetical protein
LPVVRKSEFAEMCNVSKGRVTQWITAGLIDGAAIVGEGRSAAIDVELAMAQLQERLSINERFGLNGLDTNLEPPAEPVLRPIAAASVAKEWPEGRHGVRVIPEGETDGTVEARLKAEKLKQAEYLTNRLRAEDAARHGKYIDAQEARGGMTRQADELMKIFEGAFPEFASAAAAKFQVPQREMLHLLRDEFRKVRAQLAAACRSRAESTPQTVEGA